MNKSMLGEISLSEKWYPSLKKHEEKNENLDGKFDWKLT